MVITIYEGYDNQYVILDARRDEFHERYGRILRVPCTEIYKTFAELSNWVNNELLEECLFEVD